MKRLGLAVIFTAVIEFALQMIGGAVVIGADDALLPLITTSELIVGQNRFAFGLAKRGKLIEHADVLIRVFDLEGTEAHPTAETNAPFRPVANPAPGEKVHRYGKRVVFTHQEIWQDFATKKVFSTIEEWRLQSEPLIFIVDGQGIIRARFEGLVTERELETALQNVLLPATAQR